MRFSRLINPIAGKPESGQEEKPSVPFRRPPLAGKLSGIRPKEAIGMAGKSSERGVKPREVFQEAF
jgi:hypothetical protein